MTVLLDHLRARLDAGSKLLVPYLMSGAPERSAFEGALAAVATSADAVEIGLPYSDPLMDGPVIAAAGERVIASGIGPLDALELAGAPAPCPKIVMTYYNPIHHLGEEEFCRRAAALGVDGLIVPDLPLEESGELRKLAAAAGLAWIPLVAPTSSPKRVGAIVETATGFVYAVSTLGVTGTRASLSERAAGVVEAVRSATDLPVLIGIGVSNSEQALAAVADADGVVVGSAIVKLIEEQGAEAAGAFVAELRSALSV